MEKILLIINNFNIRQLYHELLFSRNTEVVPADSIASGVIMLAFGHFNAVIVQVSDNIELEVFLKLRKKRKNWLRTKFFLLTATRTLHRLLSNKDIVLNPHHLTPKEILSKIKASVLV